MLENYELECVWSNKKPVPKLERALNLFLLEK